MEKIPSPFAGMAADILANYNQTIEKVKVGSNSYYCFAAEPGKYITFLTPRQLSQALVISIKSLERIRKSGGGPPFVKICNNRIRYPIVSLDIWVTANLISKLTDQQS